MANAWVTGIVGAVIGGAAVYLGAGTLGLGGGTMPMPMTMAEETGATSPEAAPGEGMTMPGAANAEVGAYDAVMTRMMAATPAPTGDPEVDYMQGMVPHHRAAVEMSQIVLESGTDDPTVRALAEGIIAGQEAEIAEIEAWLAARDG